MTVGQIMKTFFSNISTEYLESSTSAKSEIVKYSRSVFYEIALLL